MPPSSDTLRSIQYLRGLAAVLMVIFHAAEQYGATRPGFHFGIGALGVDMFFIISGFIMVVTTPSGRDKPCDFLRRRLVRIVPLYWLATALLLLAGLAMPGFFRPPGEPAAILRSLLFIPYAGGPVVGVGWTLNLEMQFYLIFALGLAMPPGWRLPWLGLVLGLLGGAGLAWASTSPLLAQLTSGLLFEFLAGVLVGRLWQHGWRGGRWLGGLALAAGLLAAGLLQLGWLPAAAGLPRCLRLGVPALLLVLGGLALEGAGAMPRLRLPRLLGDASYSVYLFHGFALRSTLAITLRLGMSGLASFLIWTAAGVAAGVSAYLLVERPLARRLRAGGRGTRDAVASAPSP